MTPRFLFRCVLTRSISLPPSLRQREMASSLATSVAAAAAAATSLPSAAAAAVLASLPPLIPDIPPQAVAAATAAVVAAVPSSGGSGGGGGGGGGGKKRKIEESAEYVQCQKDVTKWTMAPCGTQIVGIGVPPSRRYRSGRSAKQNSVLWRECYGPLCVIKTQTPEDVHGTWKLQAWFPGIKGGVSSYCGICLHEVEQDRKSNSDDERPAKTSVSPSQRLSDAVAASASVPATGPDSDLKILAEMAAVVPTAGPLPMEERCIYPPGTREGLRAGAHSTPAQVEQFMIEEAKTVAKVQAQAALYDTVTRTVDDEVNKRGALCAKWTRLSHQRQTFLSAHLSAAEERLVVAYARYHAQEFIWRSYFISPLERRRLIYELANQIRSRGCAEARFGGSGSSVPSAPVSAAAAVAAADPVHLPKTTIDLTGRESGGGGGGGGGDK